MNVKYICAIGKRETCFLSTAEGNFQQQCGCNGEKNATFDLLITARCFCEGICGYMK